MSKQKEIRLGFVDLEGDSHPHQGKTYSVKSASDASLASLPFPNSSEKRIDLSLLSLFVNDLPDLTANNEGLLKITVNTRNPQDLSDKLDISSAIDFDVRDNEYAPGIANRGVFRTVIFRDFINLGIELIEIDSDLKDTYNKIKGIIDGVDGLKTLDVINGIPYLNVATGLVDGVINVFGQNDDDIVWSNIPLLDVDPSPGSAFLRSGIYVAYQIENKEEEQIVHSSLEYQDGSVRLTAGSSAKVLSNCLAMSLRLREFSPQ